MLGLLKRVAKTLPPLRRLVEERDRLRAEVAALRDEAAGRPRLFFPPGHFHSPITDAGELRRDAARIFDRSARELPGLELREEAQLALLHELRRFYDDLPFGPEKREALRYHYENPNYSYSDGVFLACMIRKLAPERIVEVGSGFSSALILDVNDRFFSGSIACTFVEPHPELLRSLLREGDERHAEVVAARLQDVGLAPFERLAANDVLFVDSTHVSKTGSDVNRLVLDVLPRLAPGVHVHFHDVFHPFEYPEAWAFEGRSWNEAYLLRAFLAFNRAFEVVLSNTFLERFHREWFEREMPLCLRNEGGSLWIRRA